MEDTLFYGVEGQERLESCPKDTVEQYLGGFEDYTEIEFPIKVLVYKQEKLWAEDNLDKYAKGILEDILEDLDENYGDPDDFGTTPSEDMKKASFELAKVIIKDYHVWRCEPMGEVIEYTEEQVEAFK